MTNDQCSPNQSWNQTVSRRRYLAAVGGITGASMAGCVESNGSSGGQVTTKVDLDEVTPESLLSRGPLGSKPEPWDSVSLSDEQVQEVRESDFSVSIVFQIIPQSGWGILQRRGLESRFEELGITVEGVYGAEFSADKQLDLLQNLATRADEIDGVVSIPVDPVATTKGYQAIADTRTPIVFIDDVARGLKQPDDYAGCVSNDYAAAGLIAGRLLDEFVGEGPVGVIEYAPPLFVTDQRQKYARIAIRESDGLELAAEQSFSNPSKVSDITQNMLTANPDLKGLFVSWSNQPGMLAATAAQENGRDDLVITSVDHGTDVSVNIAKGGNVKGIAAGRTFDEAEVEANMLAHAMLGNETPAFASELPLAVTRQNLLESYEQVMKEKPPKSVTKHFDQSQ